MAEDKKIVTKKTAPKAAAGSNKTVTKKTVSKKPVTTPGAPESKAQSPVAATSRPSTIDAKGAPAKKAGAAAPARRSSKPSAEAAPGRLEGKAISLKTLANVSAEERQHMIHEAAYYRAEKRQFAPGHEVEDWAEAERQIDELLANAKRISGG